MSLRVFVIQAEGDGVAAALQLIAGLNLNPAPREAEPPLLTAAPVRQKRVPRAQKAIEAPVTGNRDAAILAALKFQPLRVAELADQLNTDKRLVAKDVPRLYSVLKRMVRDKQVKRTGKTYQAK